MSMNAEEPPTAHQLDNVSETSSAISRKEDEIKIGGVTVWAIGVGSAMGGVFFGWEFVLYGGFICGLMAVCYAAVFYWIYTQIITELSMRYRTSGGSFDFVMEALGLRAAIVIAIMNLMKLICANAATAVAISSYLMQGGLPGSYRYLIWVAIYGIFTALDCIGIRQSAMIQVIATIFCVAIIIFFVTSSFTMFDTSKLLVIPTVANKFSNVYLFFKGLPFAVQFFDGFEEIPLLVSYVKKPEITMPKAITACYFTILTIAFCVLIAAAASVDIEVLLSSDAPLMVGIEQMYGTTSLVSYIMAYCIVVGLLVNFFAFVVFTSQQMQAVAEADLLPVFLAYRDQRYGAPVIASLTSMIVGLTVTMSFASILGEESAQDTLLMAAILPTMICYIMYYNV
jgi:ethanolamine permease